MIHIDRAPARQIALLFTLVVLGACRPSGSTDAEGTGAEGTGVHVEASAPNAGGAESAGLVGPGQTGADAIEVVDTGPPSPVLLFTASLKGYTEPCGCTIDLVLGGLDRVTGFTLAAADLATEALVLDAGNLLFEYPTLGEQERAQELRKAEVLLHALGEMGTAATVPGPNDLAAGVPFYLEALAGAGVTVLAPNITWGGAPLGIDHVVLPLGREQIGVIGAVDPALFNGIEGIEATEARPAVDAAIEAARAAGATTTVLLFHGDLSAARAAFADVAGLDFIMIGNAPRHTDETEQVGSATTLEAYDQGRYVGRLKLVSPDGADGDWHSAVEGSSEEAAQLDRLITSIEERLAALELPEGEPVPPIVVTQQERLTALRAERDAMQQSEATFPADRRTYLWEPAPMEPGLPTHPPITEAMLAYNAELRGINLASTRPPEPAPEGTPHYVGVERCATCHVQEHEQWLTTQHAHAIETLETRDKQYDRNCIGCHVTGYERPGGSTLGHTDGLVNVQCEQCHGPGSMHAENPTLVNVPTGVRTQVPETACATCHNEEHSPRFEYGSYLERVLGPGHGVDG